MTENPAPGFRSKIPRGCKTKVVPDFPYQLVIFPTIGDGSCLIHGILQAYSTIYNDEVIYHKGKMVRKLRQELTSLLPRYYSHLYKGNLTNFSQSVSEYQLDKMSKYLDSSKPLGYGYFHLLSLVLKKDIYIITDQGIYLTDEYRYSIKKQDSIILYYSGNHYETVGFENQTHFKSNDKIIKFLRAKIRQSFKLSTV